MPRQTTTDSVLHPQVEERIHLWGQVVANSRRQQKITLDDLAARVGVAQQTVVRMEKGDVAVRISIWLSTFKVLGALDLLAPMPAESLLSKVGLAQRVRKAALDDDEF